MEDILKCGSHLWHNTIAEPCETLHADALARSVNNTTGA